MLKKVILAETPVTHRAEIYINQEYIKCVWEAGERLIGMIYADVSDKYHEMVLEMPKGCKNLDHYAAYLNSWRNV